MLCGALAHKYSAQRIAAIDTRITNRPMIIAGGVGWGAVSDDELPTVRLTDGVDTDGPADIEERKAAQAVSFAASVRRGKMPKLLLD